MLTVWGRRSSFNVQKVMWLVEELSIPHEHKELGGWFGGLDSVEFRNMNPHGKVPVIKDGDVVVWESHAILRYLAAQYGPENIWSANAARRAEADQWMDWSQTRLQPDFLGGVFWGHYRTPEAQRNVPEIQRSLKRCASHFQLLNEFLGDRKFLLGDEISLADIAIGTHLYRYFGTSNARASQGSRRGTAPFKSDRATGSTSWFRLMNSTGASNIERRFAFANREPRIVQPLSPIKSSDSTVEEALSLRPVTMSRYLQRGVSERLASLR